VISCMCLSNPSYAFKMGPLIILGTQNGRLIIRDLQTRDLLYEGISRKRYPGPIGAVAFYEGDPDEADFSYGTDSPTLTLSKPNL
jgi:hypothetical protein